MKKVLLTTSALTLLAGAAAADGLSFSGFAYMGVTSTLGATAVVEHGTRLAMSASTTTDGGVGLGTSMRFKTNSNGGGSTGATLQKQKVWASAGGGTVTVGGTNGAAKSLARAAMYKGFNDGSILMVDNNNSAINDSGNNILATYALGDVTIGVGSTVGGATMDAGIKFATGALTIGIGGTTGAGQWMASAAFDAGAAAISAGTNNDGDIVVTASTAMGGGTVSVGYQRYGSGDGSTVGADYSKSLGGGATASVTVANRSGSASTSNNGTSWGAGVIFNY